MIAKGDIMAAEVKKEISMKDLQKIDIRCGTILDVQDIEASDSAA